MEHKALTHTKLEISPTRYYSMDLNLFRSITLKEKMPQP